MRDLMPPAIEMSMMLSPSWTRRPRLAPCIAVILALASTAAPAQAQVDWAPTNLGLGRLYPVAINNQGDFASAGSLKTARPSATFLLGGLGHSPSWTEARALNEERQVVGTSQTPLEETHAFLWTQSTGMLDLGTLGGDFSEAIAINNLGQVIGHSATVDGRRHPFVWTAATSMVDLAPTPQGRPRRRQ